MARCRVIEMQLAESISYENWAPKGKSMSIGEGGGKGDAPVTLVTKFKEPKRKLWLRMKKLVTMLEPIWI